MNYLVPPILYKGSCFNDIVLGILNSAKKMNISFKLMPITKGELSSFGLENTNDYISNSIDKIIYLKNNLQDGDKLLIVDFFSPGLDLLEFYLRRKNISVFKVGLMHGGSFVDGDLYGDYTWLKHFEKGWFDIFDVIVSPSNFFVRNVDKSYKNKIKVLPWGLDTSIIPQLHNKKIDVVFPHRFSSDKGVKDLLSIVKRLPKVNFVVTGFNKKVFDDLPQDVRKIYASLVKMSNVTFLKMENTECHIETLKTAKIVLSTAKQEGFGYAVFKSIQCGAIPVLPNRCCYPEFFDNQCLYSSLNEAVSMIKNLLKTYPEQYVYPDTDVYNFDTLVKLFR